VPGKGSQDRYVPLPQPVLKMLRQYWGTHRDPVWFFPSTHQTVQGPMDASGLQRAFHAALLNSGIQKPASVHTLRHSYACAGFAHPFEIPSNGDAQRKQPENQCKTRWTSEVANTSK